MKPIDIKSSTYINFGKKNNDKYPNFKVGDHERISKYKNIFCIRLSSKLARKSVTVISNELFS